MSSRRIDQGGQGQYFSNLCFGGNSGLATTFILFGSSVAASWTPTLKDASLNLIEIFNSFFYVLYTSRLKALGSNPLNNSRQVGLSQYDSEPSL